MPSGASNVKGGGFFTYIEMLTARAIGCITLARSGTEHIHKSMIE